VANLSAALHRRVLANTNNPKYRARRRLVSQIFRSFGVAADLVRRSRPDTSTIDFIKENWVRFGEIALLLEQNANMFSNYATNNSILMF
jgi:hypothetical protein